MSEAETIRLTYNVPEVAKILGLSRCTAYTAATRGDLPGVVRCGKRILVSKAALERALANGWQPPDK